MCSIPTGSMGFKNENGTGTDVSTENRKLSFISKIWAGENSFVVVMGNIINVSKTRKYVFEFCSVFTMIQKVFLEQKTDEG